MSPETAATPTTMTTPATSTNPASAVVPLPPMPAHWTSLARAFVVQARESWAKRAMADSTKVQLTYGDTFTRAAVLARVFTRLLGPSKYVGLLVPPMVPTAVANLAISLLGKVPVNLNYTASQALVDSSIDQCGITQVITSQKVLDKFGIRPKGELVLLEDLPAKVTKVDKVVGASVAKLLPVGLMGAVFPGLKGDTLDDVATVIFTSGSTGDPKGVVLSNRNVLSNVHQMSTHIGLLPDESVLGILPFFHSFGFTVEIATVLCLGKRVAYHISPLDARIVGDLCEKHGVTLLVATPTFFRTYLKKCDPKQFKALVHLLLGAEKVKPELGKEIRETLGIDVLEGYGCTELSPVVAVNVLHDVNAPDGRSVTGNHLGTVGQPLPGTSVKTVDPETGADLPRGTVGVIEVKGPQVMVGYLNKPEATAKVLKNGWYSTGDLGFLDDDGFLHITDRLSRFAKVAGEMVPHLGVEQAILDAAKVAETAVAVTSIPDAKRGEKLVVLYTEELGIEPKEVERRLQATEIPRLWIPSADSFVKVETIPILGTGKVDLRRVREIAKEGKG